MDKAELADIKLAEWSAERRAAGTKRMLQAGKSVGISFKWGGKIGSTRDAHRLMYLSRSKSPQVQRAIVDGLYAAYHELEKDISTKDVLREISVKAGLEASEVDNWLDSDIGADSVDEEARQVRERIAGSGVPTYFIRGVHRVDGAQDMSDFMDAFIKVKEDGTMV